MLKHFLRWLFPQPPNVERIENLSAGDFAAIAARPLEKPPAGILSAFKYRDPLVRQALWLLKYRGNRRVAKLFAELLSDQFIETVSEEALYADFSNPIIIPIPLSHERMKERGWNQAEMLARELQKIQPAFELQIKTLKKIRHTAPQTSLSRAAREKNLKGCFVVAKPELIKNRNIILIDDVTTTGSTILEARRALLKSDARRVLAFTIAH